MLSPEWMKKSGRSFCMRRKRADAAARFVDAPALADRVAGPDKRDRAPVAAGAGAEAADRRFAQEHGRRSQVLESHAIEDVLTRRETLEQRFRREVTLRQRIDRRLRRGYP